MNLPVGERLLLGPGPSPLSAAVMAALGAPPRSHLDPDFVVLLDDLRTRLGRVFRAPDGSLTLATSGTGTSAMEAAVANLAAHGRRALAIVSGYFGERLAVMLERYGCEVTRLPCPWGRAVDPDAVRQVMGRNRLDLVTVVHAETSTGVVNPVREIVAVAREHDALTIVDAVTSLGAMPVDVTAWQADVCYSCSQKGLGAPSGLSPLTLTARALERRVPCRSFYLDVGLLEDFWVHRRYHHTISAPLVYALHAALSELEQEGLEARWERHRANHLALVEGLARMGLSLLPPPAERLWNLNAIVVPDGVEEAPIRRTLLTRHQIEIGGGLGPLAGRIWRVGLMGSGSTRANADRVIEALADALEHR